MSTRRGVLRWSRTGVLAALTLVAVGLAVGSIALDAGHGASPHNGSKASTRFTLGGKGAHGHGETSRPDPIKGASATATDRFPPVLDAHAAASFARLSEELPGRVELAVAPLSSGEAQSLGGDAAAAGWSTTKVLVLSALLRARREELTEQEQAWADSAITESNNESVLALFGDLEQLEGGLIRASAWMQGLLRESGDEETIVATAPPPAGAVTTFGQTLWKPTNAIKFFSALARGCLLSARGTGFVLGLMQHIEPSESWGLGSGGFASVAFKGGWGPEPDGAYLVRQSGIVDIGSPRAIAVSIVAFPPAGPASFEAGTAMLTETARWLRGHLHLVARGTSDCG
jgi:hypothetical protein